MDNIQIFTMAEEIHKNHR